MFGLELFLGRRNPFRQAMLCLGAFLAIAIISEAALAQSAQTLSTRIDRLQQDLNQLRQSLYSGGSSGDSNLAPTQAASIEIRLSQLENQLRQMTGQMEDVRFEMESLSRRMDQLVGDVDQRLQRLEAGAPLSAQNQDGYNQGGFNQGGYQSDNTLPQDYNQNSAPSYGSDDPSAGDVQTLGSISQQDYQAAQTDPSVTYQDNSAQTAVNTTGYDLPGNSAKDKYDHAFGLLRQANYDEAELALRAFIEEHPRHGLAGNAKYWLGETYYVRGNYQQAAIAFAEGFQQYPNNAKAPDNLLKLGMSLASLGAFEDACSTQAELLERYPTAPAAILSRAQQERARHNCP